MQLALGLKMTLAPPVPQPVTAAVGRPQEIVAVVLTGILTLGARFPLPVLVLGATTPVVPQANISLRSAALLRILNVRIVMKVALSAQDPATAIAWNAHHSFETAATEYALHSCARLVSCAA